MRWTRWRCCLVAVLVMVALWAAQAYWPNTIDTDYCFHAHPGGWSDWIRHYHSPGTTHGYCT